MMNLVSVCSIITCMITVSTFLVARMKDIKKEGEAIGNLEALKDILRDLKESIQDIANWKTDTVLQLHNHELRLEEIFKELAEIKADIREIRSRHNEQQSYRN